MNYFSACSEIYLVRIYQLIGCSYMFQICFGIILMLKARMGPIRGNSTPTSSKKEGP